ncbi:MAG: hypothetical protein NTU62_17875 [Spirochaetes bacterium]|nr:hypothetical protein [Spirochaetota bacterium]
MRLTINGEAVRFSLENERTLGEVATAVERWLADSGFVVVALSADGEDLAGSPRERWQARPVDGISELGVSVRHAAELRLEHWRAAAGVLDTLARALDTDKVDGEALAAAGDALAALRARPAGPDAAAAAARLERSLAGATAAAVRGWPADRRAGTAALARELSGTLAVVAEQAADPGAALAAAAEPVARLLPGLAEVAVQLQTGRDREAMATVTGLCDAVQRLLPLVSFLPRDAGRERLIVDLNATLRDLLAAFEAKDTVLIGDLAEYEVAPRLAQLLPLLGRHP